MALAKGLKKVHEGTSFVRNTRYSLIGLGLVAAAVLAVAAALSATGSGPFGTGVTVPAVGILSLVLGVWLIGWGEECRLLRRC
jgi:FtsH-binding integral membrane protein